MTNVIYPTIPAWQRTTHQQLVMAYDKAKDDRTCTMSWYIDNDGVRHIIDVKYN